MVYTNVSCRIITIEVTGAPNTQSVLLNFVHPNIHLFMYHTILTEHHHPQGNTAMHYAVSHGNFDVVSVLLDSKVCNVNQQNKAGYTATMLVSLAQIRSQTHASVVQRLFQLGDLNIKASQVSE